ncbi:unnamed protein product, partial [Mesorhabditis spiculigera]
MGDPFEYLDPFDVTAKLPANFYEEEGGTASKKWQERKDAVEALLKLVNDNPRLDPKGNYGELISTLNRLVGKDANINVNAVAAKCIAAVAYGLRAKFAPHASTLFPTVIEKLKEKKPLLRDPVVDCLDKMAATTSLDSLQEFIISGLQNKNPQIKAQTSALLYRCFKTYNDKTGKATLKAVAPILIKNSTDADLEVRSASLEALGSMIRATGPAGNGLIKDLADDKTRMDKINAALEQAKAEVAAEQQAAAPAHAAPSAQADTAPQEVAPSTAAVPASVAPAAEVDPFEFLDPVDVVAKLPANFYEEEGGTASKKWQERKEALEALDQLIRDNPKLSSKANYGELIGTLSKILAKDANINVAGLAAKCLGGIAYGLRKKFTSHVPSVLPAIIDKFKEKKPQLREPLIECIDRVGAQADLEQMEEALVGGLENKNPQIKAQTDLFLERMLRKCNAKTMPKKIKAFCVHFVKHTGESDAEVREAAYNTLGALQRIVGEKVVANWCAAIAEDKMKMTKITEACQKLIGEIGGAAAAPAVPPPAAAPPAAAPPAKKPEAKKPAPPAAKAATSRPGSRENSRPASPVEEPKKPAKESAPSELLKANGDKKQRLKDEAGLKILKWNFATPTDEHLEQLSTLLGQYALATLQGWLFSKDFKSHIKACEELLKLADRDPEALVTNSDLLLKWCTLRFFETNPSALIKVLELALRVVNECERAENAVFTNTEVNAFLPYLLNKLGDPKDHIRNIIREIIDSMTAMCGPVKMTAALLEGLKAKNARQRTEILRVLSEYIDGGALTELKPLGIMKIIAPCVADADKNVREAAIVGMVAAYRCEGDAAFKSAGKIADKEMAMLQERIKRMKIVPGQAAPRAAPPAGGGPKIMKAEPTVRGGVAVAPATPSGPARDIDIEQTMRTHARPVRQSNRFELDKMVYEDPFQAARDERLNRITDATQSIDELERAFQRPHESSFTMKRTPSQSSIASTVETLEQLDKTINDVGSNNYNIASDAIGQLAFVAQSPEQLPLLNERVDTLLQMCSLQIESSLATARYGSVPRALGLINDIFDLIQKIYMIEECPALTQLSAAVCESLLKQLIMTVTSPILAQSDDFVTVGRIANVIVIKLVNFCKPSALFEATTNNMMSIGPNTDAWVMLLRILQRSTKNCDGIKYVARFDLRQYFIALSQFFTYLEKHTGGTKTETINETSDHLSTMLQRVVNVFREETLDTLRRIPRPNPKISTLVHNFMAQLKDTAKPDLPQLPGQVDQGPSDFSMEKFWSLLHQVAVDFSKLPYTLPPLATYYKQNAGHHRQMEDKLQQYYNGPYLSKLVHQYIEHGDRMTWPSEKCLIQVNDSLEAMLKTFGETVWGERKNPLRRRPEGQIAAPPQELEMSMRELPQVNKENGPAPSSARRTEVVKKPRRSVMQQQELDNLRARLNAVGQN